MSLLACRGQWESDHDGQIYCSGTLQDVSESELHAFPTLTYSGANAILAAVLGILATAWVIRRMGEVIR